MESLILSFQRVLLNVTNARSTSELAWDTFRFEEIVSAAQCACTQLK